MIAKVTGCALLLAGAFIFLTAVVGLYRMKYILNRMHAAALCDALGIFLVLAGLAVLRGLSMAAMKLVLILLFLWITSPVASHLLAEMEIETNPEGHRAWEEEER